MTETVAAPTLASVVVLSIQEFGRKPVAEQIKLKTALEKLVREAIGAFSDPSRLVLDAPGGFAVVVLGAPAAALKLAERARADAEAGELPLRVGLNHGPIKLVDDARRGTSVVGDGVNTGLMLANATQPGRLLASRGFREALKIAAPERVAELRSEGTITDPDVRTHETYSLDASVGPARRKRRLIFGLIGVGAIVALGFGGRFAREHYEVELPFAIGPQPTAPSRAALAPPPAPAPVVERAPDTSAVAPSAPAQPPAPAAPVQPAAPPAPAVVELRITPRGEVYVDGKHQGATPPLTRLELRPGRHTIEVRNSGYPTHRRQVTLDAGQSIRLRHTFQAAAPEPAPQPVAKPASKPAPKPDEERTVKQFARDAVDEVRRFSRKLGF